MSNVQVFETIGGIPTMGILTIDGISPDGAGNYNITVPGVAGSGTSTAGNLIINAIANGIEISETKAQFLQNYTVTNFAASPYTAVATDYYISVDTAGGAITINLPNAPTTNRKFIIKDKTGHAMANNISVTTPGGTVTIDGLTTYEINENYEAIEVVFNGTSYEVF